MLRIMSILVLLVLITLPCIAAQPNSVLVVYNANSNTPNNPKSFEYNPAFNKASLAVAKYYASQRAIPEENLLGLPNALYTELINSSHYLSAIAAPIWKYLSTHPHINYIVLCYGIPSRISYQSNYDMSVDAALALLGNPGVPDAQGEFARHWGINSANPYCGKDIDFGTFKDSAENSLRVTQDGVAATWKLNYLVTRLDAYSQPTVNVNGTAIPRDVKAMIDRSVAAKAGGKFVVDRGVSEIASVVNRFTGDLSSANIVTDSTTKYLTGESDVIGYWGEHMIINRNANNYTTWTRPFHKWLPGGIAIYNTNDGHSYRIPKYTWWAMPGVTDNTADKPNRVLAGHIKVINMYASSASFPRDQYDKHQVVLCDSSGKIIKRSDNSECRATFSRGVCTINISNLNWPADHKSSIELRFPVNDALFPDGYIYESRSPHVADTTIYNARQSGITFDCSYPGLTRVVSSSYIAEGASGTISLLNHIGSSSFYNAGIAFSRYYAGYSWAESAYMAIPRLGTHYTVLGDPLMAPFATKSAQSSSTPKRE